MLNVMLLKEAISSLMFTHSVDDNVVQIEQIQCDNLVILEMSKWVVTKSWQWLLPGTAKLSGVSQSYTQVSS